MSTLLVREKLELTSGVHVWKVKVHKSCAMISIGVSCCSKTTGWWYCSTGCTNDNSGAEGVKGPSLADYSSMDFISVRLDADNRQLSFGKNDGPLDLAFTDLPKGPLCPAAKITGATVTRKDVQFIHEDGTCMDVSSVALEPKGNDALDGVSPEVQAPPVPVDKRKMSTTVPIAVSDPKPMPSAAPQPVSKGDKKSEPLTKSASGTAAPPPRTKMEAEPDSGHHRHDHDHHKHDRAPSSDDGARPKPAWVNAAGRLLHGTKTSTSWCKGHGPMFKTKKGSCSRCECLPCPECVHTFQNIRDTLLTMLTKYHCDVDTSILSNYSLMFTGLKKNGDVKVDVHHRCCTKHKQRFISSLTINTCCRKHKVETCERIVQTLKENARSSRPRESRHEADRGVDDLNHDMDEMETDDMEDGEEEEPEHDDLEDEESSAHSSDGSHKAEAPAGGDVESAARRSGANHENRTSSGANAHGHGSRNKSKGSRRNKKRGRR